MSYTVNSLDAFSTSIKNLKVLVDNASPDIFDPSSGQGKTKHAAFRSRFQREISAIDEEYSSLLRYTETLERRIVFSENPVGKG